ncbi:MAG: alpha/beta fold hydrolase [Clostridia bacterium]|nr:alpha/beta fold hydrolase [Clostridia bacterium]
MPALYISIAVIAAALVFIFGGSFYAYRSAFYRNPTKKKVDPYRALKNDGSETDNKSKKLIDAILREKFEDVYTESQDGLKLHGYMLYSGENERFAILMHGYKSSPFIDFSGGAMLLFRMGYNVIMADERAHGLSEGRTISFGTLESLDAVCWARFVEERFGEGTPTALVGISMGAATVILAAEKEMPKGVFAAIADCPYSSAKDIIKKVAKEDMGIPGGLSHFLASVGARIYGGFSLGAAEPIDAVKRSRVPLLIIHGEGDGFVPIKMSFAMKAANPDVRLETFPDATHGTSYLYDTHRYEKITSEFLEEAYLRREK